MATLPVSYTTIDNMITTFSVLSNISSATLHYHAGDAQSRLDMHLSKRYALPLTAFVPVLQPMATDAAIYLVLSSRKSFREEDGSTPWYDRFKAAMDWAEKISNGELPLLDESGSIIAGRDDVSTVWSSTSKYHPTFHEGDPLDMVQDKDKLNDILTERSDTLGDV